MGIHSICLCIEGSSSLADITALVGQLLRNSSQPDKLDKLLLWSLLQLFQCCRTQLGMAIRSTSLKFHPKYYTRSLQDKLDLLEIPQSLRLRKSLQEHIASRLVRFHFLRELRYCNCHTGT